MSGEALFICTLIGCIWIAWPLHSIADELKRLRHLAERGRR